MFIVKMKNGVKFQIDCYSFPDILLEDGYAVIHNEDTGLEYLFVNKSKLIDSIYDDTKVKVIEPNDDEQEFLQFHKDLVNKMMSGLESLIEDDDHDNEESADENENTFSEIDVYDFVNFVAEKTKFGKRDYRLNDNFLATAQNIMCGINKEVLEGKLCQAVVINIVRMVFRNHGFSFSVPKLVEFFKDWHELREKQPQPEAEKADANEDLYPKFSINEVSAMFLDMLVSLGVEMDTNSMNHWIDEWIDKKGAADASIDA